MKALTVDINAGKRDKWLERQETENQDHAESYGLRVDLETPLPHVICSCLFKGFEDGI